MCVYVCVCLCLFCGRVLTCFVSFMRDDYIYMCVRALFMVMRVTVCVCVLDNEYLSVRVTVCLRTPCCPLSRANLASRKDEYSFDIC